MDRRSFLFRCLAALDVPLAVKAAPKWRFIGINSAGAGCKLPDKLVLFEACSYSIAPASALNQGSLDQLYNDLIQMGRRPAFDTHLPPIDHGPQGKWVI